MALKSQEWIDLTEELEINSRNQEQTPVNSQHNRRRYWNPRSGFSLSTVVESPHVCVRRKRMKMEQTPKERVWDSTEWSCTRECKHWMGEVYLPFAGLHPYIFCFEQWIWLSVRFSEADGFTVEGCWRNMIVDQVCVQWAQTRCN